MKYEGLTTDELLDKLPCHLHLARNTNADPVDRWRLYNIASDQYVEPGKPTARELLIYVLNRLDN